MEKLKEIFVPSLIASATSVALYHFWLKEDLSEPVPLLGMELPAYATVGVSSFIGSVAGEYVGDILIPKIPHIGALGSIQEAITPPVITGLTTYGSMVALVHKDVNFMNSFALGAIGNLAGNNLYRAWHY